MALRNCLHLNAVESLFVTPEEPKFSDRILLVTEQAVGDSMLSEAVGLLSSGHR